ncbi:TetR/AcrR family transcriptional regulator [uncultured Nocardioides sp.]|uniref:TetR/AcrR family transcriptional regulator n=1 Tax=uncultured Nocardioides sp. TaxID=198441 RepID=UPI002621180C|nr:TetR/AcrR family transcriptional regulator [uncultured Nocardioides sp.]
MTPVVTDIEWTPKARAVLAAADELFYDRGIHAVGVDLVAERAGVTKKTLYDRFGSKDRLVVAYLEDRDARWRVLLAEHLDAAGPEPAARVAAVFDASAAWTSSHAPRGCGMINAHAEISDPDHPAYAVITGQKAWMLALFADLVGDAAPAVMLLHEGALAASGMGAVDDAFAVARDAALRLLQV